MFYMDDDLHIFDGLRIISCLMDENIATCVMDRIIFTSMMVVMHLKSEGI